MVTSPLSTEDQDEARAKAVVKAVHLPPEIGRVTYRTGSDSTGDPALWVVLWINKDVHFDPPIADLLHKAAEEVQWKMMEAGLSRFPYITLDQAA